MLEGVWRKKNPLTLLVGMQTDTIIMENSMEIPLKTRNKTTIGPSNPTTGHISWGNQNWKRHMYLNIHYSTAYNSAALFTITMTWKQPRCPWADEWIRKLWYIYMVEYYSAIKRNAFESVLKKWMNLEPIIQSEVSQKEKDKYNILTHI